MTDLEQAIADGLPQPEIIMTAVDMQRYTRHRVYLTLEGIQIKQQVLPSACPDEQELVGYINNFVLHPLGWHGPGTVLSNGLFEHLCRKWERFDLRNPLPLDFHSLMGFQTRSVDPEGVREKRVYITFRKFMEKCLEAIHSEKNTTA